MPGAKDAKPLRILYIDDSPDDRALMSGIVATLAIPPDLTALPGIHEATKYFVRVRAGMEPAPHVVLLDYNLDGHTGADVLPIIHSQESGIPVVMFSGSEDPGDIAACYRAGASCYLKKPDSPVRTKRILETIRQSISVFPLCEDALKLLPEYRACPVTAATCTTARSLPRRRRST